MESYVVDRNGVWPRDKYRERFFPVVRVHYLTPEERKVFNRKYDKQYRYLAKKWKEAKWKREGVGILAILQRKEEGISN